MEPIFFTLTHYSAIAALALLSYTFGRQLTWRVTYNSFPEQASFSIALGLGVISYLVFLLGLFGLLYRSVVLITLLAGLLACYRVWIRWPHRLSVAWQRFRKTKKSSTAIVAGIAIIVFALSFYVWILPLYPPFAYDSVFYHLPTAKIYAHRHRLVLLDYLRLPIFPQANHMLFTLALLVYDDILAHLVETLMLITLLAAVVAFGKRLFSERTGWWAAALLLANPMVIWLSTTAYIDTGVTLYTTVSVYAFWNWLESRKQHWLLLAGAYCGLGIGIKYSALLFLAALTLFASFIAFRERKWRPPVVFAGVTLLVAAPWLIRNFYYTRNPLFPLLHNVFASVFGYGLYQADYYREIAPAFSFVELGNGWQLFLTLPWQLAFIPGTFSSLYLYLLPLSLVFAIRNRRILFLLALVAGFTLCWFLAFQQLRYLVPVLPLLSLAVVAPIDRMLQWIPLKSWAHMVTGAGLVISLYPASQYAAEHVRRRGPVPVNYEQRNSYLARRFPSYPSIQFLNDKRGDRYTLYALFLAEMAYFPDGNFIGDHFGPGRYQDVLNKLGSGEDLYKHLRSLGVDHFLTMTGKVGARNIAFPSDGSFETYFQSVHRSGNIHLFQLREVPRAYKPNNLILNGGFEELKDKQPVGWYFAGNPVVDSSGEQSFAGRISVRGDRASDVLYQRLALTTVGSYVFSCKARGATQPGAVKLQIIWYDRQGHFSKEDIVRFGVGTDWTHREASLEAPANGTSAIIYVSALDSNPVWFDDLTFVTTTYEPIP